MMSKDLWYGWSGWNLEVFKRLYFAPLPKETTEVLEVFHRAFKMESFPYWFAAFVALSIVHTLWFTLRGKSTLMRQLRQKMLFLISCGVAFVVCAMVADALKDFFAFQRPYVFVEGVVPRLPQGAKDALRSFPSGHATFAGFLLAACWSRLHWFFKGYAVLAVFLVATSRVMAGVHFPADVVYGALLGIILTWIVYCIVDAFWRRLFL